MDKLFPNVNQIWPDIRVATFETLQMTIIAGIIAGIIGLIIGIVLLVTNKDGLTPNRVVYYVLDKVVDIGRSIPFIILLAIIVPFTRLIVHTSVGTTALGHLQQKYYDCLFYLFHVE